MTRRLFGASILRKALSVLRQPIIAGTVFVGLIFLWLIPAVHFRAMIDSRLYALMNWSMLVDGLLFWFLVMDPRRTPPARLSRASGILLSLAVQVPQIAGGAFIGFANHSYYTYYDLCGRLLPSVSAVLDQEIGGSIIWLGGGMMSAAAALVLFERIWRDETARSALQACD